MSEKNFQTPTTFVDNVEIFSGSKLNCKAELLRIYEEAEKYDQLVLFEELAFTAKYIQGLLRIVSNNVNNPEITNIEDIKKDFSSNMEKAIEQLKKIIENAEPMVKKHFEENYFELSGRGFNNINELFSDLEWAKKYINAKKRA